MITYHFDYLELLAEFLCAMLGGRKAMQKIYNSKWLKIALVEFV